MLGGSELPASCCGCVLSSIPLATAHLRCSGWRCWRGGGGRGRQRSQEEAAACKAAQKNHGCDAGGDSWRLHALGALHAAGMAEAAHACCSLFLFGLRQQQAAMPVGSERGVALSQLVLGQRKSQLTDAGTMLLRRWRAAGRCTHQALSTSEAGAGAAVAASPHNGWLPFE